MSKIKQKFVNQISGWTYKLIIFSMPSIYVPCPAKHALYHVPKQISNCTINTILLRMFKIGNFNDPLIWALKQGLFSHCSVLHRHRRKLLNQHVGSEGIKAPKCALSLNILPILSFFYSNTPQSNKSGVRKEAGFFIDITSETPHKSSKSTVSFQKMGDALKNEELSAALFLTKLQSREAETELHSDKIEKWL